MMKALVFSIQILLVIATATIANNCIAQEGEIVKYYDSLWHPTNEEGAQYVGKFEKVDTLYQYTFYYLSSHKIYSRGMSTKSEIRNQIGPRVTYFLNGKIKDTAYFYKKNFASSLKSYYPNGTIKDSLVNGDNRLGYKRYFFSYTGKCDSLEYRDSFGRAMVEGFGADGSSIFKKYKYYNDSLKDYKHAEGIVIAAEFIGGSQAWAKYLQKNLDVTTPSRRAAPNGKYTVMLSFIVNEDGSIGQVVAENDPGYGCAEEAVRVLKNIPKWNPAIQDGKYVTYKGRQSLTFMVSSY
ncbi:energy transducer TonB [Parasediminibacterium sp. JCM 36343]|uniref:energy transducer TonB n=1 Tax=Parasediminibacterium sp. JCM 36343 TaxID=3374279 RepID=UPI00397B7E8D